MIIKNQQRYAKAGHVQTEITQYVCKDGDHFIRRRAWCVQMAEFVVTDFRKGDPTDLWLEFCGWGLAATAAGQELI